MTDRIEDLGTPTSWAVRDRRSSRHAMDGPLPDEGPDRAMEVLYIAQRTAEEHMRTTRAEAETMRSRALASAGEILRDAEAYAEDVRRKAEQILTDANNAAEKIAAQAQERADELEQRARMTLSEARSRSERMGDEARLGAEELRRQAKAEYDDVLERLQAGRESLVRQIESLEQFDRDYRIRLLEFMQGQMRALWTDSPQVFGEPGEMPVVEFPLP